MITKIISKFLIFLLSYAYTILANSSSLKLLANQPIVTPVPLQTDEPGIINAKCFYVSSFTNIYDLSNLERTNSTYKYYC